MYAKYGKALDALFPGANRDKRIARAFGCTDRFAKHLRRGNHWTLRRIAQAAEMFGDAWEAAVTNPDSNHHYSLEFQEFSRRLAKLEQYVEEMDRQMARALASDQGAARNMARGGHSSDESVEPYARTNSGNEKANR